MSVLRFVLAAVILLPVLLGANPGGSALLAAANGLAPHAPIFIWGDEDFARQAAREGWPGSGTLEDPYRIEDCLVQASGEDAIFLRNVSAHFVIQRCVIVQQPDAWEDAIVLIDTPHARVVENDVSGGFFGIFLVGVTNATLAGNHVHGANYGIYVFSWSHDNRIEGNTVVGNLRGIDVTGFGSRNLVARNLVTDNSVFGLRATFSQDTRFEENTLLRNGAGIAISAPAGATWVSRNSVRDGGAGIEIRGTVPTLIEGNLLHNNSLGISGRNAETFHVRENVIEGGQTGIALLESHRNRVEGNTLRGQAFTGISLDWENPFAPVASRENILSGNVITDSRTGIHLGKTEGNRVEDNVIKQSEVGLQLSTHFGPVTSNLVTGNLFSGNALGIHLRGPAVANTFAQNRLLGNALGLLEEGGRANLVYDNLFRNAQDVAVPGVSANVWNVTKAPGPNVVGGPFLGGNVWTLYAGVDLDGDGLGDAPQWMVGLSVTGQRGVAATDSLPADHHPLVEPLLTPGPSL